MIKKIIFILIFTLVGVVGFAQTKAELERRQQELKREIETLNNTLKSIRQNKNKSLASYNAIKRKIAAREELIQSINKDMRILDDNIYLSQLEINRLHKELDTLKASYSKSLVFAYKNRSNYDYLNFIFSASTFNDAVKRITYLKSYREYREQQVDNINKTQQLVENKVASLNNSKAQKSMALQDQSKQLKDLEVDRREQNDEVNKLKGQENDLAAQIKKRESDRRKTSGAIAAIIRREIAEARKREQAIARQKAADEERRRKEAIAQNKPAKEPAKPRGNTSDEPLTGATGTRTKSDGRSYSPLESTDEAKAESISFEGGKGRLPWPVDAGNITIGFGPYSIPETKLKGLSDGIYIATNVGSSVKAVADGEVASVYDLGGEQAVTIKHGKYFTTYSHLSSVNVSSGQQVRPGTVVGRAAANDVGEGEVLFMVSNDKLQFLNPSGWLRKR